MHCTSSFLDFILQIQSKADFPALFLSRQLCILVWDEDGTRLAREYGLDLLDFTEKYRKSQEKGFWSTNILRRGHIFLGHAVHRGKKFYLDFKHINLPA
jgi:hypothetical protein